MREIKVLDKTIENNNLKILKVDVDGTVICDGDIVVLKPEWCSPGEEKYFFVVKNINEITGRCDIVCLNSSLTLGSIETVGLEMIDPTGENAKTA